jgi:hypothetical protein
LVAVVVVVVVVRLDPHPASPSITAASAAYLTIGHSTHDRFSRTGP